MARVCLYQDLKAGQAVLLKLPYLVTTHLDPGVNEGHGVDVGAQRRERREGGGGEGGGNGWGRGLGGVTRVTSATAAPRGRGG